MVGRMKGWWFALAVWLLAIAALISLWTWLMMRDPWVYIQMSV